MWLCKKLRVSTYQLRDTKEKGGLDHAGIHFEVSGTGMLSESETEGPYN